MESYSSFYRIITAKGDSGRKKIIKLNTYTGAMSAQNEEKPDGL